MERNPPSTVHSQRTKFVSDFISSDSERGSFFTLSLVLGLSRSLVQICRGQLFIYLYLYSAYHTPLFFFLLSPLLTLSLPLSPSPPYTLVEIQGLLQHQSVPYLLVRNEKVESMNTAFLLMYQITSSQPLSKVHIDSLFLCNRVSLSIRHLHDTNTNMALVNTLLVLESGYRQHVHLVLSLVGDESIDNRCAVVFVRPVNRRR